MQGNLEQWIESENQRWIEVEAVRLDGAEIGEGAGIVGHHPADQRRNLV